MYIARSDAFLISNPDPRPGDVSHWPEREGPLPAPPVPPVRRHSTVPGTDFELKAC